MRISDWSSDVFSSDLQIDGTGFEKLIPPLTDTLYLRQHRDQLACFIRYGMTDPVTIHGQVYDQPMMANDRLTEMEIAEILTYVTNAFGNSQEMFTIGEVRRALARCQRSEEHTSELQSLMRISYAVFC